ncbi:putative calcium-binding protein cml27 [Quercus suber]|uniref:Calcium-binding protein cml27 n=1 Tax=Quercus suber TaxID=58331 RepID=A0AAW0L967_QUESU
MVVNEASHRKLSAVFSSLDSSFFDQDELCHVMDEFNFNHDGFISLIEFVAFCYSNSEDGRAFKLHDVFKLYDQD